MSKAADSVGFLPGWEEYVRNTEVVSVFQYDGTEQNRADLLNVFPDNFQVRKTKNSDGAYKEYFCLYDDGALVVLKPVTYIVRDSCGHFYPYEEEFFDFMFSRPDDSCSFDDFARVYYETCGGDWESLSKEEQKIEVLNMAKFCRNYLILRR